RLFDASSGRDYWPRVLITDASRHAAGGEASVEGMRFLHVGQRARVESVLQTRQPGQLEAIVARQVDNTIWSPEFGNMLFQLGVPHELKGTVRGLRQAVLVLDAATANLPWEMLV